MVATIRRFAVAVALLVLGLSGCSSPSESVEDSTSSKDAESVQGRSGK